MANYLVTTKNEYTEEDIKKEGLISAKVVGSLKEYQTVVAVGPVVRGIKVGDLVCIDPSRYLQLIHKEGKTSIDKKVTAKHQACQSSSHKKSTKPSRPVFTISLSLLSLCFTEIR